MLRVPKNVIKKRKYKKNKLNINDSLTVVHVYYNIRIPKYIMY